MCSSDICLGVLALFFPPIAVWVKAGICSADSLINICLCMLGFIPGLLHAWYIIAKYPDPNEYGPLSQDEESGRVTYVIVTSPNGHKHRVPAGQVRPANQSYGTTAPMAPPVHQDQNGTWGNGEGSAAGGGAVPPTYAEAVRGDNKVQTQD